MFDLTSMQDATEHCSYPELVGEPVRLELNFTFPLEYVSELIVMRGRMSSVAVDKFGVVEKKTFKMDNVSLQQIINRIPLLKYRYRGSFLSDYDPTLDKDIFAFINTQPSKKYSCLKQHYEQMMSELLQSHPGFLSIYVDI